MKILNICQDDFANFMYDNMKALRSVGLDCDSVKLQKHPFYEEQAEVTNDIEGLKALIGNYDIIQFFHDNLNLYVMLLPYMDEKRIFAYHTSSYYRANSAYVNEGMCEAEKHIACMPEFVAMCPGSVYMVGAVDTDKIIDRGFPYVYKFAHFPSNQKVKGSSNIWNVFEEMDMLDQLSWHTDTVPHASQLSRIEDCEIYIEMCTEKDGLGSTYGNFGITALEAAALGKIVITQCRDAELYTSAYGSLPFELISGPEKLKRTVLAWSNYNGDHLKGQQQATRDWVVRNHSYKATGEYFIKNVLNF